MRLARHQTSTGKPEKRRADGGEYPVFDRRTAGPMPVPSNKPRMKALPSKSRIDDEPQEILDDPEQHDRSDDARFELPGPLRGEEDRGMEEDCDERKYVRMVTSHRAATPEKI